MSLLNRVLKIFRPQEPNRGGATRWSWPFYPNTRYDYVREAGDLWTNSPASICINRKATMLSDLTLIVERWDESKGQWLPFSDQRTSELLRTFRKPNDYYGLPEIIALTMLNDDCRGHSIMHKTRNERGQVVGYWVLPYHLCELMSDRDNADGTKLITHVRYYTPGGAQQDIPWQDCVMIRQGIDPRDMRAGLSPLAAQLREICTDNEAGTRMPTLLRNGPEGNVLSPKSTGGKSDPTVDQTKAAMDLINNMARDKAGKFVVIPFESSITQIGLKPSDMDLGNLRAIPTDRICAALGGDPMAFGLPSTSKTYSNLEEALDALGNNTVLPTANRWARQWGEALLPDFRLDPDMFRLAWRTDGVSWLKDEKYDRNTDTRANFEAGIIDRAEAKIGIGMEPTPADKGVTYFQLQAQARGVLAPSDSEKKYQTFGELIHDAKRLGTTDDQKTGVRPEILKMGIANVARLANLGRVPGAVTKKPRNRSTVAQSQHDKLISLFEEDLMQGFTQYADGRITMEDLQKRQSKHIYDWHRAQYRLGFRTGGGTPTDEQLDAYARIMTDRQSGYMLGFLDDIENGRYNDADGKLNVDGALRQRSKLYALQSSSSASAGFIEGSPDDSEFDWELGPTEHCEDCLYISALGPFDKETIFTNPREGDTVCLGNCKCRWVRSDGMAPFGPLEVSA
jgi:phage portal protein BeeE